MELRYSLLGNQLLLNNWFIWQNFEVWFLGELQVDISTMLEGAVEYVKFLQLQIKVTTWASFLVLTLHLKFSWLSKRFPMLHLWKVNNSLFSTISFNSFWALTIYGCTPPSLTMEWTLTWNLTSTPPNSINVNIGLEHCLLRLIYFVF